MLENHPWSPPESNIISLDYSADSCSHPVLGQLFLHCQSYRFFVCYILCISYHLFPYPLVYLLLVVVVSSGSIGVLHMFACNFSPVSRYPFHLLHYGLSFSPAYWVSSALQTGDLYVLGIFGYLYIAIFGSCTTLPYSVLIGTSPCRLCQSADQGAFPAAVVSHNQAYIPLCCPLQASQCFLRLDQLDLHHCVQLLFSDEPPTDIVLTPIGQTT